MNTNTNEQAISNSQTRMHARAALTVTYHGPTNTKGGRYKVSSQHTMGSRYYAYDHALNTEDNARQAADLYLQEMMAISHKEYGTDARAWGTIDEYAHGVTHDGAHVFCSTK